MLTSRNPSYDSGGNLLCDSVINTLPAEVRNMLTKLLAIRVSNRYASPHELLLDWDDYLRSTEDRKLLRTNDDAAPVVEKKEFPRWVYAAIGGGLTGIIILILLIAHFLK